MMLRANPIGLSVGLSLGLFLSGCVEDGYADFDSADSDQFERIAEEEMVIRDPYPYDPDPYDPPPEHLASRVVTVGDSFGSGTGIHNRGDEYDEEFGGVYGSLKLTPRSDQECWREDDTTPGPERAAAMSATNIFAACKGAQVTHVRNQMTMLALEYPTLESQGWPETEILVSAGGNDIETYGGMDWPELLKHCILTSNCHNDSDDQIANWSTVRYRLKWMYIDIMSSAPNATIAVMGYPLLMRPNQNWLGNWKCTDVTGISANEAWWIDDQVEELNRQIRLAIADAKVYYPNADIRYVDTVPYMPTGSCVGGGGNGYINDKVLAGLSTSDASFHPTQNGYDAYYDALEDVLGVPY